MLVQTGKRITTTITGPVKERLQMAADLVGATINQFVIQAAVEKAEKIIEKESSMTLTCRESLRLIELIEHPPARNKKFLQAIARYQDLKNGDQGLRQPERTMRPSREHPPSPARVQFG
jgi:uncharacterized protein (DUF1778 family)